MTLQSDSAAIPTTGPTHAQSLGSVPHGEPDRPLKPALLRGWRRHCPNCGSGPLFAGYLKVRDHCPVCQEAFHHQRADDGPAYLTILIVGHLMAPVLHLAYVHLEPEPLVLATVLSLLCATLALYLLPRIKGAFVALQWAKRMHGFGTSSPAGTPPSIPNPSPPNPSTTASSTQVSSTQAASTQTSSTDAHASQ